VRIVEEIVSIDKRGRIVIPASVRRALSIKEGGKLRINVYGSRIILEPLPISLDKTVEEWVTIARETKAEISVKHAEIRKWMSHEYARRKIGLP